MKHLTLIIAVLALLGTSNAFATTVTIQNNTDYTITFAGPDSTKVSCVKGNNRLDIYNYTTTKQNKYEYDNQGNIESSKEVDTFDPNSIAYSTVTTDTTCSESLTGNQKNQCMLVPNPPSIGYIVRVVNPDTTACSDSSTSTCTLLLDESHFLKYCPSH